MGKSRGILVFAFLCFLASYQGGGNDMTNLQEFDEAMTWMLFALCDGDGRWRTEFQDVRVGDVLPELSENHPSTA